MCNFVYLKSVFLPNVSWEGLLTGLSRCGSTLLVVALPHSLVDVGVGEGGGLGLVAHGEVLCCGCCHGSVGVLLVGSWEGAVLVCGRALHGAVEMMVGRVCWLRILRETWGRDWVESARAGLEIGRFYQVFDRILKVCWHERFEISFRIFFFVFFFRKLFNSLFFLRLLPLNFQLILKFISFLLILFFLGFLLPMKKLELLLTLFFLILLRLYSFLKISSWFFLEIFYTFQWFFLSCLRRFLGSTGTFILFEVWMIQNLSHFRSVLSINPENLFYQVDLNRIWISWYLPNLLEKINDFFISAITSSPVSPLKGA